jgi:hypothetical protein
VVKAVTLEVDVVGAQKLSLAASIGSLSLMLRKAGEANSQYTRKITLSDLGAPSTPTAAPGRAAGRHHGGGAGALRRERNTACRSKARTCTQPAKGFADCAS